MASHPEGFRYTSAPHSEKVIAVIQRTVNGEARTLDPGSTVAVLLALMELTGKRVAVEKNGEIIPKGRHAGTVLQPGDALEIVAAVGGG